MTDHRPDLLKLIEGTQPTLIERLTKFKELKKDIVDQWAKESSNLANPTNTLKDQHIQSQLAQVEAIIEIFHVLLRRTQEEYNRD